MKRTVSFLLIAALVLSLAACGPGKPEESPSAAPAADELARAAVLAAGRDPEALENLTDVLDSAELDDYIENYYGLDAADCADRAVYRAAGADAFEIAVLRLSGEDAAREALAGLENYLHEREGDFTGYSPAQADIVSRSLAAAKGPYAALLICEDAEAAREAIQAVLAGEEPPVPASVPLPERSAAPSAQPSQSSAREVTADEGARAYIQATDTLTPDDLERRDTGLSGADRSALLAELGVPEDAVTQLVWYRTPDGAPLFLEVFSFRLAEGADCDAIARALEDYGSDRSKKANASYIDAQGRNGTYQLMQQSVAVPGYALLGLISFDENGAPLGTVKGESLPSTLFSYCYHVGCVKETTQKIDGQEYTTTSPPDNATSSGFVTYLPPADATPEPIPSDAATYPDRTPFTDPDIDDMSVYDTSAILAAWKKRDPAGLSDYDRTIYDKAEQVLSQVLTDGMSDYDKERALYLWIITHIDYDWNHQNPFVSVSRDSYTPYGGLIRGKAVCLGYSSAFQLLMDMAGVECITVVGAAYNSEEDHAWNMVKLDGAWYCVDATWDWTYYNDFGYMRYFNVSSDFMAAENHQWDYNSVPEAPENWS